jgi:hypothetical protein
MILLSTPALPLLWRAIIQCARARWHSLALLAVECETGGDISERSIVDLIQTIQKASTRRLIHITPLVAEEAAPAHAASDSGFLVAVAFQQLQLAEQRLLLADQQGAQRNCQMFLFSLLAAAAEVMGKTFSSDEQELILDIGTHLPKRLASQLQIRRAVHRGELSPRLTFVLGMHRSGTSALSGMLCQSGFNPPQDLMPATINNPRGYWESLGLCVLNDEFLHQQSASWNSVSLLPQGWEDHEITESWRARLLEHLQTVYAGSNKPIIKDPRFSILLRGLTPWLESGCLKPSILLISRDPMEVARSLEKAEGIPIQTGINLWLEYTFAAEKFSRSYPRLHIGYDKLLQSPQHCLQECRSFLASVDEKHAQESGAEFITPELHRQHRSEWEEEIFHDTNNIMSTRELALRLFELLSSQELEDDDTTTQIDILFAHWHLLPGLSARKP